jgi:glycerol dehydrogenase-like iron-containing ADH family enzyme
MDAPTTAEQLFISDKDFCDAAKNAKNIRPRYTILNKVSDHQIDKALKRTGVVKAI